MPAERILVVDDSPTQVEAARALLERHGYAVVAARTGQEALELATTQRFDLVLSDVVMPGMTGYELCRRIKHEVEDPPPVVLLTSLTDPRDIVRGVECGADNYITKPYEPATLADRIRHVVDNHRLRRQAPSDGPVTVHFLGETYTIASDPPQILALLLSSFEELIRTNAALQDSKRQLAEAHERELRREQDARAQAEADTRRMEVLKQKAEAAARLRDEVLATVSHDLKNPLGTIYTSSALLLDMEMAPEAQRRQLEIIRRTATRMDRLIQDLLDVSRMEAGRFAVDAQPDSARSLVLEARRTCSPRWPRPRTSSCSSICPRATWPWTPTATACSRSSPTSSAMRSSSPPTAAGSRCGWRPERGRHALPWRTPVSGFHRTPSPASSTGSGTPGRAADPASAWPS
jgi:two-component system, sensor histidine kinase and response regulator